MTALLFPAVLTSSGQAIGGPSSSFKHTQNASKYLVKVRADLPWTPTGIQVHTGDDIDIDATGVIEVNLQGMKATPAGAPPDCIAVGIVRVPFVAPSLPCWSLIGRIGRSGNAFEVGIGRNFSANADGELYLGVNDNFFGDNSGAWLVTISGGVAIASGNNTPEPRCMEPATGHLKLSVVRLDKASGWLTINGFDDRRPQETPFTWVWGDHNVTQGWFPQSHAFANKQGNYVIRVISHENDGSTDCAQIAVSFSTGEVSATSTPSEGPADESTVGSNKKIVRVPGRQPWTQTGIYIQPGDIVTISASGGVSFSAGSAPSGPAGDSPDCYTVASGPWGWRLRPYVANELPCTSLLGRIREDGTVFYAGAQTTFHAATGGQLFLGVNDNYFGDNSGYWTAEVTVSTSPPRIQSTNGAWLGFANDTSPQDREIELRRNCGDFQRVVVPDDVGNKYTDLCRSVGSTCVRICDWEGRSFPCDAVSLGGARDGTRVALCR